MQEMPITRDGLERTNADLEQGTSNGGRRVAAQLRQVAASEDRRPGNPDRRGGRERMSRSETVIFFIASLCSLAVLLLALA